MRLPAGPVAVQFQFFRHLWANHQDVFGRDFTPETGLDLLPAPAVSQGNGNGALGLMLANNMFVQFKDDFLGRHG